MSERAREMAEAIAMAEAADADEDEGAAFAPVPPPREPSQVYSVRIPANRLEQLRRLAAERQMQPTALVREWVVERLEAELGLTRATEVFDVYGFAGGDWFGVKIDGAMDDVDAAVKWAS